MGISLANEALIMSRRITAEELLKCGFVNKVFETTGFLEEVMGEVGERFGGELNWESLVRVKGMIGRPERRVLDEMNVAEVFGGLERFVEGIPQEEFRRIASGEKRHKL